MSCLPYCAEVQQQHGHDRSQQQEHQRLLEEEQTKQGEKISQLRQQQQDVPDKEIKGTVHLSFVRVILPNSNALFM